jgi:hypothetical protein
MSGAALALSLKAALAAPHEQSPSAVWVIRAALLISVFSLLIFGLFMHMTFFDRPSGGGSEGSPLIFALPWIVLNALSALLVMILIRVYR